MIEYHFEVDFNLSNSPQYTDWITRVLNSESKKLGEISYIFCSDNYLLGLNQDFLQHDTLTDIITFDYSEQEVISGDIFISVERVKENALELGESFERELRRVMIHGVLHMVGYNDKSRDERKRMRSLEEEKIGMFHVEQ